MEPISQKRICGSGSWLEEEYLPYTFAWIVDSDHGLSFTQVDCLTPQIQSQLERTGTRRKCQEFTRQWVRVDARRVSPTIPQATEVEFAL